MFRSFLVGQPAGKVQCVRNGLPALPQDIAPKPRNGRDGTNRLRRRRVRQEAAAGCCSTPCWRWVANDIECVFVGTTEGLETIGEEHVAKIRSRPDWFTLAGELERRSALEYVAGADVFCLPSGDESQPIAPLEAGALGVPCALTDLPPYAGTWKHGENCLLRPGRRCLPPAVEPQGAARGCRSAQPHRGGGQELVRAILDRIILS